MKENVRSLKKRLYRFSLLPNRISRAKYYHGHNVHSPFVYGLVRNALMPKRLPDAGAHALFGALTAAGVPKRRALQLQGVMEYCGYGTFSVNATDGAELAVLTADYPAEALAGACDACRNSGVTLVVMQPYACRERQLACRAIVGAHRSTSVDNRAYLILFNNRLPKQHFRL